jgi:hypothetical protein
MKSIAVRSPILYDSMISDDWLMITYNSLRGPQTPHHQDANKNCAEQRKQESFPLPSHNKIEGQQRQARANKKACKR